VPRAVFPYDSRNARREAERLLGSHRFDRVLCYLPHVASLVPPDSSVRRFLVVQDVAHHVMSLNQRYAKNRFSSLARRWEVERMKAFEEAIYPRFEGCSVVSEAEADRLEGLLGTRRGIHVIPNGVAKMDDAPDSSSAPPCRRRLVYIGSMEGARNVEGATWLLTDIFPEIRKSVPDVALDIVGRNPPRALEELGQSARGVRVTGRVDSAASYLGEDAIFVSTNRVGTGIRNAVLEALGAGVPCLATPASLEGISGSRGTHYLVCEDAAEFAWEAVRLLRAPEAAADLGAAGQRLAREKYDWDQYFDQMAAMMEL
jgi:glycosyltransferase involved in cell wall biosynthesis